MTFQAYQIATNFTTDWALLIALTHMNVEMQSSIWLLRPANERQSFPHFTVDVVTLWTWCWSLFALTNRSFGIGILNTAVLKGFYAHINQFVPMTSIQCHFFPLVPLVLMPFSSLQTFHCKKKFLWQATFIHSNDITSPTKITFHDHGFNAW